MIPKTMMPIFVQNPDEALAITLATMVYGNELLRKSQHRSALIYLRTAVKFARTSNCCKEGVIKTLEETLETCEVKCESEPSHG